MQNTFNDQPSMRRPAQGGPTVGPSTSASSSASTSGSSNSLFNSSFDNPHNSRIDNEDNNEAIFYRTANNSNNNNFRPPPPSNRDILNQIRSLNHLNNRNQQPLPNVNINQLQRTVSYASPRNQAMVPQGFFQWSIFIFSFPFKFLFATIVDWSSFFCEYCSKIVVKRYFSGLIIWCANPNFIKSELIAKILILI